MAQSKLTKEILDAAIEGFEAQKQRIDNQIAELRAMLPGGHAALAGPSEPSVPRKKRRISAAGRKAIAEAQRKRWAAKKVAPPTTTAPKKKHRLSAAGRKAIAEAQKKRWAMKKATAKAA
jgi:hypothetical protein